MKVWKLLLPLAAIVLGGVAAEPLKLTALERSQGWRLLFDGEKLTDWHGYRQNKATANWSVKEGAMVGDAGPALVSDEEFEDFELQFDWKVADGGHGEVYFMVSEDASSPDQTGPVMELIGHPVMGGNGGLTKPDREITPQFGEWYRSRIVVFGNHVEYWISGDRVQSFIIDGAEWKRAVAASPFKTLKGFAAVRAGRLALSGAGVSFRNVKVKTTQQP